MSRLLSCMVVVVVSLAAAACVGVPGTANVSERLAAAPTEQTGTVVGSIGIVNKGTFHSRYALLARNLATNERVEFYFTHDGFVVTKPDFREGRTEAALIALRLPEGRYAIEGYEFRGMGIDFNQRRTPAPQGFSIPFEVKAGQATYIGEYLIVPVISWRFLGAKGVRAMVWEIADRRDRDMALARQRRPDAPMGTVISAVPDAAKLGVPFFFPSGGAPPDEAASAR